jgi:hypothetical protein
MITVEITGWQNRKNPGSDQAVSTEAWSEMSGSTVSTEAAEAWSDMSDSAVPVDSVEGFLRNRNLHIHFLDFGFVLWAHVKHGQSTMRIWC